ncbi:uncharacterized protein [Watersipora subatra]|uniref:uncharacterized protein n=1 Tax=Watersipora subatra TaxID=2589382 RepID=UPI00355B9B69
MDLKNILMLVGMMLGGSYAISCYNCGNCDNDVNVRFDCSTLFDTDSCYITYVESTDTVSKSCGIEELDELNFIDGCIEAYGSVICRCRTNYCNTNDLIASYHNQTTLTTTEQYYNTAVPCTSSTTFCLLALTVLKVFV